MMASEGATQTHTTLSLVLSSLESLRRRRSLESVWCMLPASDGKGRYAVCLGLL